MKNKGVCQRRIKNTGSLGIREGGMNEYADRLNGLMSSSGIKEYVNSILDKDEIGSDVNVFDINELSVKDQYEFRIEDLIGDYNTINYNLKPELIKDISRPKWVKDLKSIVQSGLYEI